MVRYWLAFTVFGLAAATTHVQEPSVLPLTGATFASALTDHPLLFVLFYSAERIQGTHLLTNYSLAADELRQNHLLVKVKLAWLEVRWDDAERVAISRRFGVSDLPDIKIFHHGRPSNFEAAASKTNIVDIVRWNAGHQQSQDQQLSRVVKIVGSDGLERAFQSESVLLLAFTNHWCTRCLLLRPEFEAAADLLYETDPPVVLATVRSSLPSASRPDAPQPKP